MTTIATARVPGSRAAIAVYRDPRPTSVYPYLTVLYPNGDSRLVREQSRHSTQAYARVAANRYFTDARAAVTR